MSNSLPILDQLEIASPCSVSWDEMKGDECVRHCGQCDLNVYNLSGMSAVEATTFVQQSEGRVCVRMFRRHDGTVITKDCPVGVCALRRQLIRMSAGVAALVTFLFCGALARAGFRQVGAERPMARFSSWFHPPEQQMLIMGEMIMGKVLPPAAPQPTLPQPTLPQPTQNQPTQTLHTPKAE